jgi:hypothetical protein
MTMLRLYFNALAFGVGLSNFVILVLAVVRGHALTLRDFIFPALIQVLLVSLVFILLKLVQQHDARIVARALAQRRAQIANFKTALRNHVQGQPDFSRGFKTWNS